MHVGSQAECLQRLAESILEACSALPDADLSAEVEADARRNAQLLFRQSVEAYKKVLLPTFDTLQMYLQGDWWHNEHSCNI